MNLWFWWIHEVLNDQPPFGGHRDGGDAQAGLGGDPSLSLRAVPYQETFGRCRIRIFFRGLAWGMVQLYVWWAHNIHFITAVEKSDMWLFPAVILTIGATMTFVSLIFSAETKGLAFRTFQTGWLWVKTRQSLASCPAVSKWNPLWSALRPGNRFRRLVPLPWPGVNLIQLGPPLRESGGETPGIASETRAPFIFLCTSHAHGHVLNNSKDQGKRLIDLVVWKMYQEMPPAPGYGGKGIKT